MEGRELPAGWATATGSETFELVTSGSRGWAKYYSDDGPLFIRMGNLDHGSIDLDLGEVQCVTPPDDSEGKRTRLEPNDILISITAELGMVALVPEDLGEAYVNQHVALARPSSEIDARYLAWYLASESDGKKQLLDSKRGATKVGLGLPDIRNLILPLAPLNEQRRIAAKLDTTLAVVDACRQRLDGVADLLKRFRQAVLAAATSGELTREWREERGLGHEPFKKYSLKDLVQEPLRNGKSVRDGDGDYVLRLSCLKSDSIDWAESKRGSWEGIAVERFLIQKDDFLVARGNGSKSLVGRGCLVDEPPPRMAFPDTMIRIRPDQSRIHPVYLSIAWEHRSTRDQIESSARTSAGIWKVAQSDLEVIRLSVPSYYEEQVEVVGRAQGLFTLADQLEARLAAARKVVDRLTPALLAKAFRGELVPQDPEDEPASVLLERLVAKRVAARQAGAAAAKPSRRGRPKAAASPVQLNLDAAPVPSDSLPPHLLANVLRECGPLSERALLAASELRPETFRVQLAREQELGAVRESRDDGQVLLEAVG